MTVYDFVEFLAKGIDATRDGRYAEALVDLRIAAQAQPENPRVWLWLAAGCDSLEDKRRYLQRALALDPASDMPRLLLARLDRSAASGNQKLAQEASFVCEFCGGKLRFDPDLGTLICDYCQRTEILSKYSPAPLSSAETTGNWAVGDNEIVCDACGARISSPYKQNTVRCPFCGSDYVIVRPAGQDLIRPGSILPFQIHSADSDRLLAKVKGPNSSGVIGSPQSIYLPFWCFSGRVRIYLAQGYKVPLKIFSPVDRVVAKGDWPADTADWPSDRRDWPLNSYDYQRYNTKKEWPEDSHLYELVVHDLVLYAGHSFNTNTISLVFPFDLQGLVDYRDEILVEWQAEFYQIALDDARVVAYRQMREQAISSAARRKITIDPDKLLEEDVTYTDIVSQLILLPFWVCHFKQGDQGRRALLNGQNGKSIVI